MSQDQPIDDGLRPQVRLGPYGWEWRVWDNNTIEYQIVPNSLPMRSRRRAMKAALREREEIRHRRRRATNAWETIDGGDVR